MGLRTVEIWLAHRQGWRVGVKELYYLPNSFSQIVTILLVIKIMTTVMPTNVKLTSQYHPR